MKTLKRALALVLISSVLAACNTVNGAGEDISSGGKEVSKAASSVQQKM